MQTPVCGDARVQADRLNFDELVQSIGAPDGVEYAQLQFPGQGQRLPPGAAGALADQPNADYADLGVAEDERPAVQTAAPPHSNAPDIDSDYTLPVPLHPAGAIGVRTLTGPGGGGRGTESSSDRQGLLNEDDGCDDDGS